jgi:hypothetical protein
MAITPTYIAMSKDSQCAAAAADTDTCLLSRIEGTPVPMFSGFSVVGKRTED